MGNRTKKRVPTDWLLYSTGSLTRHLEKLAGQKIVAQVQSQRYRMLSLAEKQALGLPLTKPCIGWVRTVQLCGNNKQAWVKAKSIFPINSLVGDGRRLKQLGDTPIGYVLFNKGTLPFRRTYGADGRTRQTVYDWQGRPLLITETFCFDIKLSK